MTEDELLKKLTEEHESDFTESNTNNSNEEGNNAGGDSSKDNSVDEANGASDSSKDNPIKSKDNEGESDADEAGKSKAEPVEPDDKEDPETERVGEKKDANSRIRQLLEENKKIKFELAEKQEAERKEREAKEDPVYTLDQFLDSTDEDGEPLTEKEAKAKFAAWDADYKLRQYQKTQVMKDQQNTLIELQKQTNEAFEKFPEFNVDSEHYDEKLAGLANMMFEAGLEYDKEGRIIGSKVNPSELLSGLHELRSQQTPPATKVNNLGDSAGQSISSQQINKATEKKYAPNFRGEVDKELDKLIKKGF